MRVLVVDDSSSWRKIHRDFLREAGFEVEVFSSLSQAKQAEGPFDAYVVDSYIGVVAWKAFKEGLPPDGVQWAKELANAGEKVVLCAWESYEINGIRFVLKGEHTPIQLVNLLKRI
jgi:CheY-like chemotaxis protein